MPGGGSTAALQAALSASLLAMVSNLTLGRKRFADREQEVSSILQAALELRNRAATLVQTDIDAYQKVAEAMALPRSTDTERKARSEQVQSALKLAAEPPLETMAAARESALLAVRLAAVGNPSAISDVGVAALSAGAAYLGARLNVEINMAAVRDEQWIDHTVARLAAIPDPADDVRNVYSTVLAHIRGTS